MGVAGSGKSTIGELLAARLGLDYADADEFHNPANVAKMASGTPLTDDDRWPWLNAIGEWLAEHESAGAVVTCSALRRSYRDVLRSHAPDLVLLHIDGPPELMQERVAGRPHHFMPAELVASQFDTLERPDPGEHAIVLAASDPPDRIVDDFLDEVAHRA